MSKASVSKRANKPLTNTYSTPENDHVVFLVLFFDLVESVSALFLIVLVLFPSSAEHSNIARTMIPAAKMAIASGKGSEKKAIPIRDAAIGSALLAAAAWRAVTRFKDPLIKPTAMAPHTTPRYVLRGRYSGQVHPNMPAQKSSVLDS